jgi:hypothetical protein
MVDEMVEDMVEDDVGAAVRAFVEQHSAPCCELHNDQSYEESCGE